MEVANKLARVCCMDYSSENKGIDIEEPTSEDVFGAIERLDGLDVNNLEIYFHSIDEKVTRCVHVIGGIGEMYICRLIDTMILEGGRRGEIDYMLMPKSKSVEMLEFNLYMDELVKVKGKYVVTKNELCDTLGALIHYGEIGDGVWMRDANPYMNE